MCTTGVYNWPPTCVPKSLGCAGHTQNALAQEAASSWQQQCKDASNTIPDN